MSIHCDGCGLEYAGGRGGTGVFAQKRRIADPRYLAMLVSVKKFGRLAQALLDSAESADRAADIRRLPAHPRLLRRTSSRTTRSRSCRACGRRATRPRCPIPRAICSSSSSTTASCRSRARRSGSRSSAVPAPTSTRSPPRSATYARRPPIRAITRKPDGVELIDAAGDLHHADAVVIATHADDALALLTDPSDDERRVLGAFEYSDNETLLHRDASQLPTAAGGPLVVELSDGRLRSTQRPDGGDVLDEPAPGHRERRAVPGHAQRLRTHRPGDGRRDDGLHAPDLHARLRRGAGRAARPVHRADRVRRRLPRLGIPRGRLPLGRRRGRGPGHRRGDVRRCPSLPALVEGTVGHTRRTPLRHRFTNRVYQWLVDVDDLPRMPRLLRPFSTFSAADHIGDPRRHDPRQHRAVLQGPGRRHQRPPRR